MALVAFKKGKSKSLPAEKAAGTFYVLTDECALYLDIDDNQRIRFGNFQEFDTLDDLKDTANPSKNALYYITSMNCLAVWNGTSFIQLNPDKGATDIEVIGSGNAVTAASYDAATRKITLTMGTTFATAEELSSEVAALKQEITEKTSGIASDDALTSLQERVGTAEGDIDALEKAVGTVDEGKTVVEMISDAQAAATYDDTAVKADIKANADAIAVLNGDDTGKSVRDVSAEEVAKVVAGADESLDTLKEIADWISSHKEDASAMNSAISALEAIVAGIGGDGEKATIVAYVTDAITALKIGDYALAADLTALAERVTKLEGSSHTHSNKDVLDDITSTKVSAWDSAEQNAKDYADGLASNYDAAGAASSAETSAKEYTDTALTWGSF